MIAFEPYKIDENSYINKIQRMFEKYEAVIDYQMIKKGLEPEKNVRVLYLNWIENKLDDIDRKVILEAKANGTKVVWVFHNRYTHDIEISTSVMDNYRFMFAESDIIILLSKKSEKYCLEYYPSISREKLIYIPHPNYIYDYNFLSVSDDSLEDFLDAGFVFSFLGTIRPYKNIEILIEAYIHAFSGVNDVALLIIGECKDVSYVNKLQEYVKGYNIKIFSNKISDLQMGYFIEKTDVVVLPYDMKSSMNSGFMINAFSYKSTVITSNIAMSYDFDDSSIYRYEIQDDTFGEHATALEETMRKAYNDGRKKCIQKGIELFEHVSKYNSMDVIEQKYVDILNFRGLRENDGTIYGSSVYGELNLWKSRYYIMKNTLFMCERISVIAKTLTKNNILNICLYGYGEAGKYISEKFREYDLVIHVVDAKFPKTTYNKGIYLHTLNDRLPNIDIVIITAANVTLEYVRKVLNIEKDECIFARLEDIGNLV